MMMRKQGLSQGHIWLLCWYIQFTGFIIYVVQYNSLRTLYDLSCYVPSLTLATDTIHALRLLLTLVAYPYISFVLYKTRPSPLLIGSGCLSVAVECALMGWSTFGDIRQNQSEADTRRNSSVDDLLNSTVCSSSSIFNERVQDWPPPWEILSNPALVTAVAAQVLLVYGVAVHFVAGMTLVENVSGGTRSVLVLAFLLIAMNSAPYIGSLFTPLVTSVNNNLSGFSWDYWESILRQGWVPLGVTSLFLTPLAFFVTPSETSQGRPRLPQQVTSVPLCQATGDDVIENIDVDKMEAMRGIKEFKRGFLQSLHRVLGSHLVLCNALSLLFITAGIVGVDQIQVKLGELLKTRRGANEDNPVQDFLINYSAHFINYGPSLTLFICGGAIFKMRPPPRRLLMWSTMVLIFMLLFAVIWSRQDSNSGSRDGIFKISFEPIPESCRCSLQKGSSRPPLCSEDGVIFTSACQAGCKVCIGQNRTQHFSNCSALPTNTSILSFDQCVSDTGWDRFLWILYIFIVVKSLVSTARVIGVFVSIRCVSHGDKPISLALVTAVTSLTTILDRDNFYAQHITELTCLAIIFTFITWHFIVNIALYESNDSLQNSHLTKHRTPFSVAGKTKSSSKHGDNTLLPRESLIDESELLDVRIMSRQRDSIDVTKSKWFRVKRMSLGYRKRSMPSFEEHVVYP